MSRQKKKKIMTVDELYSFCLKNNFAHFDSDEFGKELMVRMNGNFEKNTKDDNRHLEGLTPFVSRAFHDHVNLNKSDIPEESFNDNLPSANFRPILAHIILDEETQELDFGSHDFYITKDKDGNDKTIYEEQPIGVIDGSKTTIEYDEDAKVNRAVLHGFLYDEYCQDAIDILDRRGTVDCSVELCIRSLSFDAKNKTMVLEDFYVSGLTLLSAKVNPGMAGSNFKIEDFAVDTKSLNFENNNKLVETLEKLTKILESFSIDDIQDNSKEGGTNLQMNKFEELLKQYNKTVDDIDFEYETMSDEELEAKFAELFGEGESDNTDDTQTDNDTQDDVNTDNEDNTDDDTSDNADSDDSTDDNPSDDGDATDKTAYSKEELFNQLFDISFNEIHYALNVLCSIYRNDNEWCYVSQVYDDYFIMEDWDNNKYYKQSYEKDGDNVSLTGERIEMFAMMVTESEKIALEDMRSNYAALVEFKEAVEKNELHAKREAILSNDKYASVSETESFKNLVKTMDNYSLEDLEKEAKIIFADNVDVAQLSATEKKNDIKVFANVNKTKKDSRYGNLFSK